MATLLENLAEFVKMIFGVLVTPNYGSSNENLNLLRWLFIPGTRDYYVVQDILLLTFGIMIAGVSIGILRRFLWKN